MILDKVSGILHIPICVAQGKMNCIHFFEGYPIEKIAIMYLLFSQENKKSFLIFKRDIYNGFSTTNRQKLRNGCRWLFDQKCIGRCLVIWIFGWGI